MDPVHKALVGGFFVLIGLVMVLLRTQVQLFYLDLFEGLPWPSPFRPRGRVLTVMIIVFGVLSIIGGGLVLAVSFS
jgi:hypothetical protein